MKKWINKNGWLMLMVIGSSILFWTLSNGGEAFIGQIPIACILIITGVTLSSTNEKL